MIATGQQIRAARAALGWPREVLAKHAGVSPGIVAYWERAVASSEHRRRARARERIVAVLRNAGIEFATDPRPAVFFGKPRAA